MTSNITTLNQALKFLDSKARDIQRITDKVVNAWKDFDLALMHALEPLSAFDEIIVYRFIEREKEFCVVVDELGIWFYHYTKYKPFGIPFELLTELAQREVILHLREIMTNLLTELENRFMDSADNLLRINLLREKLTK